MTNNTNKKGFTPLAIVLCVAAAVILIGGVLYYDHTAKAPTGPANNPTSTTQYGSSTTNPGTGTPQTSTIPGNPVPQASVSPASGPVGTVVTIHGSGFGKDNTILMDGLTAGGMKDIASTNGGTTLTFEVPSSLGPNCKPDQVCAQFLLVVTARAYPISVITNGATQNIGTFTLTGKKAAI